MAVNRLESGTVGRLPISDEVSNAGVREDEAPFTTRHVVGLLLLTAALAVGSLGAGGFSVYRSMKQAELDRKWIDHSQLVLANLLMISQRFERLDYNLQLYAATGDKGRLRAAQMPLSNLSVDMVQLGELVHDNESQTRHTGELQKSVQQLTAALATFGDSKVVPDKQLMGARNVVALMQQEERGLLRQRTDGSKVSSYRSFLVSSGYLGFSFMVVVVLFLFLFRDAMRRKKDETRLFAAKKQLETTIKKLTGRARESALLTSARDEMQLCMTSQQAHESTVRHMAQLLPGSSGATLMINNSRRMVEIAAQWGETASLMDGFNPDACCGLRAGKARWRKPGKSELNCLHFLHEAPTNYLCVPLAAHGETLGFVFVCVDDPDALALAEERMPLIQEMSELAALSIASLNLRAKLEGQSIRDGLTGLFNRHFMETALERELHRAARQGTSLAVMMIDVDHFKVLNDTFGHEAGDVVLREVAECFRRMTREEDVICRYGGEEFVVIMPDALEETAARRAEMIRTAVAGIRTHFRGELLGAVTVSVGIAMYPDSGKDGRNLIQLADGALYRAKHAGRNQVMLESTPEAA